MFRFTQHDSTTSKTSLIENGRVSHKDLENRTREYQLKFLSGASESRAFENITGAINRI